MEISPKKIINNRAAFWLVLLVPLLLTLLTSGCLEIDPLKKHKILTTIFDGVPDLPALEELCEDNIEDLFNQYYEKRISEANMGDWEENKTSTGAASQGSRHRPWKEKDCQGCHNFQATNKLHRPKNEICYLCHKNFIQGRFVHGPVSVGACMACHDPHSSGHPSLLRRSLQEICFMCHLEKRLASQMHDKIMNSGMVCVNCHDPHSSDTRYFLK